ncbi:RNA-directed DNA polymerase [Paenibacillus ehimensis]|uniref:RNA-directed DNA polymerase n=1 Tax=Paenibacillus ehimensis TaxID=79264 RepID=UPI0004705EF9|nr:RNA-directed DNA polymerase [Paenibacillus ehimensis]
MARQMKLALPHLVSYGFFPSELIPAFSTTELGNIINNIMPSLSGMNIIINGEKILSSKGCVHSIPRILHHRRLLTIPNPFHQVKVFEGIVTHWQLIKNQINTSKYSLTKPLIGKGLPRAINRSHNFNEIPAIFPLFSSNSRYVLRTDISRYYATIYTHSIPWACHGKAFAKNKANRGNNHFGNLLDTTIRNTQDQQTIGIPIGPDSSLIVSELIGSAMDKEIYDVIQAKGFRYIDDMYFFFNSIAEAEEALIKIQKIAKNFELEINPEKTEIYPLPIALEHNWASEIRNFQFSGSVKRQKTDLVTFFSKAFEYCKIFPNDYVLKYSLSRLKYERIHQDNWQLYQSLILNSMIAEPSVLPTATEIFKMYEQLGYNLNYKEIYNTCNNLLGHHAKLGHGYEVSWSLWLAKTLKLKVSRASAKEISLMDDCISILTALDLRNLGLMPNGLSTTKWTAYLTHENLFQDKWLFAYEAVKQGWLTPRTSYLSSDPFFSILNAKNVHFYDPNIIVSPSVPKINAPKRSNNKESSGIIYSGGGSGRY